MRRIEGLFGKPRANLGELTLGDHNNHLHRSRSPLMGKGEERVSELIRVRSTESLLPAPSFLLLNSLRVLL